jgi:hypothetical protein
MAEQEKDPLFPVLPEDLKSLSDDEVQKLLDDSVAAAALIDADDEEFLAGLTADEIIAQYTAGVESIKAIQAENKERVAAYEEYKAEKERLKAERLAAQADDDSGDSGDEDDGDKPDEETVPDGAVTAEAEAVAEETVETPEVAEEQVPVTASAPAPRLSRTPPAPAKERIVVETVEAKGAALVASSQYKAEHPGPLDPSSLANLMRGAALDLGPVSHDGRAATIQNIGPWQVDHYGDGSRVEHGGGQIEWAGPKTKVAGVTFEFPADRQLTGADDDLDKVRAALPPTVSVLGQQGTMSPEALTASGGICAPSTPFYGQVNFATEAEPVWDSLPVFQAARGGVNVPTSTYIADITTAISSISEENDALGGTFATKSCQDLTCPEYTETFVNIFAHCREYGNLNARTWPEKINHENALTMAALSRTSETFMLDRIKALSVNVTNGAETLGALIYLIDAIVKARFGIIGRFRMPRTATFRALIPYWVPSMLVLDNVQTQFDRFRSEASLVEYLRSQYIEPTFYLDSPTTGTTQLPDAAQTAAAIDALPDNVQWAIYPDGAFLGIDSGSLELGIVRDSTLNSTNDFQVFGERFRNLVRLAPAQAAYWVTSDLCASGQFPPAGTARTCD